MEEVSHWQIQPRSEVCAQQTERSQTQSVTVASAASGTSAMQGQPLFLSLRLAPRNVPKLESIPFELHINQVRVQAWKSPGTSLLAGFGELLSMSPALPQGGPIVTDFAKRWQLYRQTVFFVQGLSHHEHSIDGFAAGSLSNARKASGRAGCLEGHC